MTTGERIKQLRLAEGMTQEELGRKVGVKKSAIHKYESGMIINLKRDVIAKLAEALGTTGSYLIGLRDEEEIKKESTINNNDKLITNLYHELTPENQQKILELARLYIAGQANK